MPGKGNEAGGKGCRMRAFRKGLLRRFAWLRWNPSFSTDVRNDTAKAYSSAFNLAAAVFVVLVQCCNTLFGGASSGSAGSVAANLMLNIAFGGALFWVVRVIVRKVYCLHWIGTHREMYLAGDWLHVHRNPEKEDYIRIGYVRIKQNYNDLSVVAENFTPQYRKDGSVEKGGECTHWKYKLARIECEELFACFRSTKVGADAVSREGLHRLSVVCLDRETGYPSVLAGEYAEASPAQGRGALRLYRIPPKAEGSGITGDTVSFNLADMPVGWVHEVERVLRSSGSEK